MLALRNLHGSHNADNQGILIWEILTGFGLTEKLGWFTLDNASNNLATLQWLSKRLQQEHGLYFNPSEQLIQCFGHVLNLVVEAFLIGSHYTNLKKTLNDIEQDQQNLENTGQSMSNNQRQQAIQAQKDLEMVEWRKTGALGKLCNTIMSISRSNRRCEQFIIIVRKCKQDGRISANIQAELLVVPNDTRWHST